MTFPKSVAENRCADLISVVLTCDVLYAQSVSVAAFSIFIFRLHVSKFPTDIRMANTFANVKAGCAFFFSLFGVGGRAFAYSPQPHVFLCSMLFYPYINLVVLLH